MHYTKLDMSLKDQRQALVDTFINTIYRYDDKVLINKEGTQTVTFGEVIKVASEGNGSDFSLSSEKQRSLALKKQSVPPAGTLCFSL